MIRNRLTTIALSAAVGSIVLGLAGGKQAFAQTPLPPGTAIGIVVPTVVTGTPPFGGTLLLEAQAPVFGSSGPNTISGTVTSAVFRSPSGFLDFYYQFSFSGPHNVLIDAISIASFSNVPGVAVAQTSEDIDGAGLPAESLGNAIQNNFATASPGESFSSANRPNPNGNGINATASNGIGVNQFSFVFIVRTEALSFSQTGSASVQGGGISGFTQTPAVITPRPAGGVAAPEPTALALFAVGLVGTAAGVARRRRRS